MVRVTAYLVLITHRFPITAANAFDVALNDCSAVSIILDEE
jgi:hypothetical protein